jgi:hypothetical protein
LLELRQALASANERCRMPEPTQRSQGAESRSVQSGTLDVSIRMPEGWRTQRIPLAELVPESAMVVPSLSVEIDCALYVPRSVWNGGAACAELWIGGRGSVHCLRIDVLGVDGGRGEVRFDGVVLRKWSPQVASLVPPDAWVTSPRMRGRKRRFRLLLQGADARRVIEAFGPAARDASWRRLRRRLCWLSLAVLSLILAATWF